MSDNRTTELLREGLTEHGIKWRSGLEGVTFAGDWCFVEYDNGKLAATCEPVLTPEQAIAATLGMPERTCKSTTDDNAWCFVCSECGKSFPRSNLHLAHNHGEINYCPNCGAKVVNA